MNNGFVRFVGRVSVSDVWTCRAARTGIRCLTVILMSIEDGSVCKFYDSRLPFGYEFIKNTLLAVCGIERN